MSISSKIHLLKDSVSSDCKILTDYKDTTFLDYMKRWSDIDKQTPAAIVLPISEIDTQKTVQWAVGSSIPFVIKSGGHSEWSTIGNHGIVIDLSHYSAVNVHKAAGTVSLKGSVLSKEVAVSLAKEGMCTALGNGNTVGAIGYFLGGGASIVTSVLGYGSDQIVSARIITAKGDLVDVTEEKHPDLLWAIRGAGQFVGLITELTIEAHPLSSLGNDEGAIWAGSFVFPLDRAAEVCSAMKVIMNDGRYATAGLMMIMAPPPARSPSVVIAARLTGDLQDAEVAYKSLYDLKPLVTAGSKVPIQNTSDGREAIGAKGDFKRFGIVGLSGFNEDAFLEVVGLWKEMIAECPDAITTAFNFQWDSRLPKPPKFDSALSLHNTRFWQNNLIWHTDPKNRAKVDEYNEKSLALMRGPDTTTYVDFVNGTRVDPIERRYRPAEKLAKLKQLKKIWDPTGIFTNQLLD
ncbi:MAG: hypothetical protein M1820_003092 [Bogoriella megaspora]|nr:MAG: hypothetical protein M1820_003092 [Bogoriella megaspora]